MMECTPSSCFQEVLATVSWTSNKSRFGFDRINANKTKSLDLAIPKTTR